MTATEAKAFKKLLGTAYKTYYSSKTESMSVKVYSYINNEYDAEREKSRVDKFMNLIKNTAFSTEIIHRTYQGFIHDTCIIVS